MKARSRPFVTFTRSPHTLLASLCLTTALSVLPSAASAQIGDVVRSDAQMNLAPDSPFRDPNIIYLEADELINNEAAQVLTAQGEVEGRYQDRSLRAEKVIYNLETGQVIASGNVVLVNADGSTQYADKLELSDKLEAGTASNFTARIPGGGLTAAQLVVRNNEEEVELYNAYYTACEVCEASAKPGDKPSWRLKARKVRQDKDTNTIRYNDAVLELFGLPVFYTPYLAHPDPSAKRASGLLTPFAGISRSKGFNTVTPYYWAIDDYTEATFTPHLYTKVNPLMELQFARQFHTGKINIEGSFTYGSVFDRSGDPFDDPTRFINPQDGAPLGKRWRSHLFADGLFTPNETWSYGFGAQLTSDDNYLNRYDLDEAGPTQGLYEYENRRGTSQAFLIGQDDSFRFAISTVGFQDWRSTVREVNGSDEQVQVFNFDDSRLPILAPKIEVEKYWTDPAFGGRLKLFGDTTILTRETGSDYTRATAGLDYSKTWITPGGVEVKPFATGRMDVFDLQPENAESFSFSREFGQVGVDIRYPFIAEENGVTWIIEPRMQLTETVGNNKAERFSFGTQTLSEDASNVDLDMALLWQANKSSGYDFWSEGFRADIGGAVSANWGEGSRWKLFVGQSFAKTNDFAQNSGLSGDSSDYVGQLEVDLGRTLSWNTRLRYDDDTSSLRRVDSSATVRTKWIDASGRYYKIQDALNTPNLLGASLLSAPPSEEISGTITAKWTDNWSTSFSAYHDIDSDVTRRQSFALAYRDDCTLIEIAYTKSNFDNDIIRDSSGIGIRLALLTLGDFGE